MGRAIFISYRRDDSEGEAGRLFDDLTQTYGEKSVFMDVAGISPGMDFRKAIDENVATCGVLLAMIGPAWATLADANGHRRLENANDFVRLEIASALRRDIPVIPVLVHDAKMPHPDQLPEDLQNLAYRNSVEITHARWNSDVHLLTAALAQYVQATDASSTEPVHANLPVQLPPANPPQTPPAPAGRSRTPMLAGAAAVALLALAAVIFFAVHRPRGEASSGAPAPTPVQAGGNSPATAASAASALSGTWTNSAAPSMVDHNGLARLEIAVQGDQLSVHAWGKCQPSTCDWGVQNAAFDGQKAVATWSLTQQEKKTRQEEQRQATVTMTPANGSLHVSIVNTYSSRKPSGRQFEFVREQ